MSKNKKGPTKAKGWSAEDYETAGTKSDEIEEIKEAFDLFDNDLSGAISVAELTSSFKALGFDVAHSNVYEILKDLDKDGNGEIDFNEFLDLLTTKLSSENSREEIEKVFKMFDQDRTGDISVDNLAKVARTLGDDISNENLQSVINTSDVDQDGRLTFEDFYAIMTRASVEDRAALRLKAEANKPAPTPKAEVTKAETPKKPETPKSAKPIEVPEPTPLSEKMKSPKSNFTISDTRDETDLTEPEGPKIPDDQNFAKRFNDQPEEYRFQMIGRYKSAGTYNNMNFKKILMDDNGNLSGRGTDAMGFWGFTGKFIDAEKKEDGKFEDHMKMSLHKEYKDGGNVQIEGKFDPVTSFMEGQWWPVKTPEKAMGCQIKMAAPVWKGTWTGAAQENLNMMFAIEDGHIIGYGVEGEKFDGDDFYTLHGKFNWADHTVKFVQIHHETGKQVTFEGESRVEGAQDIIYGVWNDGAGAEGDFEVRYKHKSGFIDW